MAYIPIIKKTEWIDLSEEHKELRKILEHDVKSACCDGGKEQPIMLQGAFGIGKTTGLYYMFHYGWEVLKTPTFYVQLVHIMEKVKEVAERNPSGKVKNVELSKIISSMLNEQISVLNSSNWLDAHNILFPEFPEDQNLQQYLEGFTPLKLFNSDEESHDEFNTPFSAKIIKEALSSNHRPLLLIDEFESKYYDFKQLIETSGGGVLRELFDQIVQLCPFYLIIGIGPASGYDIAKERGDNDGSNTADSRRLKSLPVPFPTANLLKESYLKGKPNGFVNFIWWLSRCRPGHIEKLRDEVQYEILKKKSFSEFIVHKTFNAPIDSLGEEVKYLKTSFFNTELDSYILPLVKNLLLELEPHKVTITEKYKDILKSYTNSFLCGIELISLEHDLMPALQTDFIRNLKKRQDEGKYSSVNYLNHLNKYLYYILSACTDEEGNMAINMFYSVNKDREEKFASSFMIPLLELTYDFISQYEDDSEQSIKETKDFVLDCINLSNEAILNDVSQDNQIASIFDETYSLLDINKLKKVDVINEIYLQLSLKTIREIIEQPIGSPKLSYKGVSLENKLQSCDLQSATMTIAELNATKIYFIPSLNEEQMSNYVLSLRRALEEDLIGLRRNANNVIQVVSLNQDSKIEILKNEILKLKSDDILEAKLKKISFANFDDFHFNLYSTHIKDFLDSVCKIAIVGYATGDIYTLEHDNKTEITNIIEHISNVDWTSRKEERRTIEHYAKLTTEGDQSVLSIINAKATEEYDTKIEEYICKTSDYENEIDFDFTSVYDANSVNLDAKSKYLALYYIFENAGKYDYVNSTLLAILKDISSKESHLRLVPKEDNVKVSLNFDQIYQILANQDKVNVLLAEFDKESSFVSKLQKFVQMMTSNTPCFSTTTEMLNYMSGELDNHWITNYNDKMSYGFSSGAVLMRLLLLNSKTSNYNINEFVNTLLKMTESNTLELRNTRSAFESTSDSLYNNLYANQNQKFKSDNMPFKNYQSDLGEFNKLLIKLKQLITEQPESLSLLLIIESILIRIKNIIASAKSLNEQIVGINASIETKKGKIQRDYQEKIDSIYLDPLAVKLIEFSDSDRGDIPKYNIDTCWKRYSGKIRNEDSLKNILTANLSPAKESRIEEQKITDLNTMIDQVDNNLKTWFEKILTTCQQCQTKANAFNDLESYIRELLKFEKQ